ncbi:MAG: Ig-like domain-containing protein [Chloroflexota bacterium]
MYTKQIQHRLIIPLLSLLLLLSIGAVSHAAAPPLPARFYGTVQLDSTQAPLGATVSARINGVSYAETTLFLQNGASAFILDVPGDDPDTSAVEGGQLGDSVVFQIDGVQADQSGTWQRGVVEERNLTATAPPMPPVANDESIVTDEDMPIGVLLTATDVNNDLLTFNIVTNPNNGTIEGVPPNLIYTPNSDFNGTDSFTFIVNDGTSDSNMATVSITVNPAPDLPVIQSLMDITVDEGTTENMTIMASDADGDALTLSAAGLPPFATFTDNGDSTGTLTLAPTFEDSGVYPDVTITVFDGTGSSVETFTIVVNESVAAPVARFAASQKLNTAQLEDGAVIVDYSSARNTTSLHPDKAIDSNVDSYWQTANGQVNNQYITVQLTGHRLHVVDSVDLRSVNASTGVRDFEIRVSTTGTAPEDFVTILGGTLTLEQDFHTFSFAPVTARYVQFVALNNHGSGTSTRLKHFAFNTRERVGGIVSLVEGPPAAIVDVSSQGGTNGPENMIDQTNNTGWRSVTNQTTNQWVKIELGGGTLQTIGHIQLRSSSDPSFLVKDFDLQVSTTTVDDAAFATVFSGSTAETSAPQLFSFTPVPARYVRLMMHNIHGNKTRMQINTFKVLTPDQANVARLEGVGASVIDVSNFRQSSVFGDRPPERAMDFNFGTAWETNNGNATDQWFTLRLLNGAEYQIDKIRLRNANNSSGVKDFEIRVSSTGTADADFETVFSGTLPRDNNFHWYTFEPVQARYVRFFVLDTHGASSLVLRDFQVFASDLGDNRVVFDDFSTAQNGNIVSWDWDFGDGATSTERHPIHTYAAPGAYPLSLTVTDNSGLTDTASMIYTVLEPPTPSFTVTPTVPLEGESVTISDGSVVALEATIIQRLWRFDHTSETMTGESVLQTFPDNGSYPVYLDLLDSRAIRRTFVLTVTTENAPPTVNAGSDQTLLWGQDWTRESSVTDPGTVDRATLTCDWDFGDGQTHQSTNCAVNLDHRVFHAYAEPGVYSAALTVTDKDGGVATDTRTITVTHRDSMLINYGARTVGTGIAELQAGLFDFTNSARDMTGRTVSFSITNEGGGTQVVNGTVGSNGLVSVQVNASAGESITVTSQFDGDTLYNPTSDTDALRVVSALPKGDIVFIIDESESMGNEQADVKANIAQMANQLGAVLDYRFGLVGFGGFHPNAPTPGAQIWQPMTDSLQDFDTAVGNLVAFGHVEPGFLATTMGMSNDMGIRPDAGVCAVMVSDEDADVTTEYPTTREDALAALQARDAVFLGIVQGVIGTTEDDYGPNPGSLSAETEGVVFGLGAFNNNPLPVLSAIMEQCVTRIFERQIVNEAPVAEDDHTFMQQGATLVLDVLANDSDPDGNPLSVTALTSPANGEASVLLDGRVAYTPTITFSGSEVFSYTVSDGIGGTDTASITVGVNAAPVCPLYPVALHMDSLAGVASGDYVANILNGTDVGHFGWLTWNGDTSESALIASLTSPGNSDLYVNPNDGADTHLYYGDSVQALLGVSDSQSLRDALDNILWHDMKVPVWESTSDAGGNTLYQVDRFAQVRITGYDLGSSPQSISIQFLSFVPCGEPHPSTGTPTPTDTPTETPTATPTETETPDPTATPTPPANNGAPVAADDQITTWQGAANVSLDLLANDSDPDGDPLTVVDVASPAYGVATILPSGMMAYTPTISFSGSDVFTYTVSDGLGGTDSATITVVVDAAPSCTFYPVAIHADTLAGATPGGYINDLVNGTNPGNFGWLSWSGNLSESALVASLTSPGNSSTYVNPNDPSDSHLSYGELVQALSSVSDTQPVRDALDDLLWSDITVPVWESITESGGNTYYQVANFAQVRIIGYDLAQNRISIQFLAFKACGGPHVSSASLVATTAGEGGDSEEWQLFFPLIWSEGNGVNASSMKGGNQVYLPVIGQ